MALPESTTPNPPGEVEKPRDPPKTGDRKEKPLTKVIIRRLPPSISQEDFITQVSPLPDYDYIYTVKGDLTLGEHSFSRVYINFVKASDVYLFKEKFDNYVFIDDKGHEYPAVVEYSAFQKVPKRRKQRQDPKIGSIESDPVYLEFLESLKEQAVQEDKEKPEYCYQPSTENKNDVTTPLLDFLKQRKIDRIRVREEKREERRKKEIERKKMREDDRKKRFSEKFNKEIKGEKKEDEEKPELASPSNKKDRKESKYEKFDKYEKKGSYREYKGKFDFKEDVKEVKKVKKYSERREERKLETKHKEESKVSDGDNKDSIKAVEVPKVTFLAKAGASNTSEPCIDENNTKKAEADVDMPKTLDRDDPKPATSPKKSSKTDSAKESGYKPKNKENDPRLQRRIRNKDRPAMVLYKPGMLRKKSIDNDTKDPKDNTEIEGKDKTMSE